MKECHSKSLFFYILLVFVLVALVAFFIIHIYSIEVNMIVLGIAFFTVACATIYLSMAATKEYHNIDKVQTFDIFLSIPIGVCIGCANIVFFINSNRESAPFVKNLMYGSLIVSIVVLICFYALNLFEGNWKGTLHLLGEIFSASSLAALVTGIVSIATINAVPAVGLDSLKD